MEVFELQKGRKVVEMAELEFYSKQGHWLLEAPVALGQWLMDVLPKLTIGTHEPYSFAQLKADYEADNHNSFDSFMQSPAWTKIREHGLLIV